MFCTELKQLLKFSTGADKHLPCGVTLLECGRQSESTFFFMKVFTFINTSKKKMNAFMHLPVCEIIISQVMASLEYEDFSAAINWQFL